MKFNETLKELFLADNKLTPSDGVQLGSLLKTNYTLGLLDLRNNLLQVGYVESVSATMNLLDVMKLYRDFIYTYLKRTESATIPTVHFWGNCLKLVTPEKLAG